MSKNNIIVTGVSGGIGQMVAKELLENSNSIIATDINIEKAKESLSIYGDSCKFVQWDLADIPSLNDYIKYVVEHFGKIQGLVHCAGFDKLAPLYLTKVVDFQSLWTIHALAPMRLISLISKKRNFIENGSIVLISSLAAHEGAIGHAAYASAKGAIEGFLKPAASELIEKKIRLNVVVLGAILTNMSMGYIGKMDEEQRMQFDASYPLGIGNPKDAAELINFLISDNSRWITGQKFFADGGHLSRKV